MAEKSSGTFGDRMKLYERTTKHILSPRTIPQEPADALQPSGPECKASISGMCLEMVEGNSPCAIEDGECVSGGLPAREPKTIQDGSATS